MRKTMIITDPIHQVMNFGSDPKLSGCLKKLIDTPTFQRLRRISQLGLASYVFPGATHTRFSHSIGAAYLAHSVLVHLHEWSEESDRHEITEHFDEVIIAALLHDIGHGPFSHLFEHILNENKYPWAPSHEDWGETLISNSDAEIHPILKDRHIDIGKVACIFAKDGCDLPRPYRQIVSSQLDVDRMDYLIRDSHFAGVAIGRFDAHYLINSIVIVSHGDRGLVKTLGLTPKGVKAYEAFLLARQLMNRTVYYHHNVKVLEFMMEHLLWLTLQRVSHLTGDRDVGPFIPPYFQHVNTAIKSGAKGKKEFMQESYGDYVLLTDDVIWNLVTALSKSKAVPVAQDLAQKLLRRDILPHFTIRRGTKKLLEDLLGKVGFVAGADFQVVDLKTTMYRGSGDEHVFVSGRDGNIEEITEHSDMISVFRDRPEAESLLIVIDDKKRRAIETLAKEYKFAVLREPLVKNEHPTESFQTNGLP